MSRVTHVPVYCLLLCFRVRWNLFLYQTLNEKFGFSHDRIVLERIITSNWKSVNLEWLLIDVHNKSFKFHLSIKKYSPVLSSTKWNISFGPFTPQLILLLLPCADNLFSGWSNQMCCWLYEYFVYNAAIHFRMIAQMAFYSFHISVFANVGMWHDDANKFVHLQKKVCYSIRIWKTPSCFIFVRILSLKITV